MTRKPLNLKSISIDFNNYKTLRPQLIASGVSPRLLEGKVELSRPHLSIASHDKIKITPAEQLSSLAQVLRDTASTKLLVIGNVLEDVVAKQCAIACMIKASLEDSEGKCIYRNLYGGKFEPLRDDRAYKEALGYVKLITLVNLAANSTLDKIEKCRDLLSMYPEATKIVVVDGVDPLEFCYSTLHMKPSNVLYLKQSASIVRSV